MNIKIYSYAEKAFQADDVKKLYENAGWWKERTETDIADMLKTNLSVGAWTENNHLIGFARAVSDGRFRAYVEDVIIHQEWRRSGVGRELVESLLEDLDNIDIISLFCEEELIPFYEKNRFKSSKSQFVLHRK